MIVKFPNSRTRALSVQAVFCTREQWTERAAHAWVSEHGFDTSDPHHSETHWIYRQFSPDEAVLDSWATFADAYPDGISVSCCERKKTVNDDGRLIMRGGGQSAANPMDFVLSQETPDRMDDVIEVDGWELANFKRNPIALFGHDHSKIIGVWENIRVEGKRLMATLKLAAPNTSPLVNEIRALVEQRILKAVSVGFMPNAAEPIENGGYRYKSAELLEASLVAVPAHAQAISVAKALAPRNAHLFLVETDFQKGVVPAEPGTRKGKPAALKTPRADAMREKLRLVGFEEI